MKWTRQRCHEASDSTLGDRLLQSFVGVGDHQLDALESTLDERAEEVGPKDVILRRPTVDAQDGALAGGGDPDRDHGRHRDHPFGVGPDFLAHLVVGGVEPDVGDLRIDRSLPEGEHALVEALADAADLGLGDPVDAQGTHEVVHLAG
jgi:hypothetical protein